MALPIPARDICVGDYSTDYGTVKQVQKSRASSGAVTSVTITFKNGTVITPDLDMEFIIDQGGRF